MMNPSAGEQDQSELMKEYEDNLSDSMPRERLGLSLRDQEYLKHSSLFSGHHDDVPSGSFFTLFYLHRNEECIVRVVSNNKAMKGLSSPNPRRLPGNPITRMSCQPIAILPILAPSATPVREFIR